MTIAFVDSARPPEGQPLAGAFYRTFPNEPIGRQQSTRIDAVVELPKMTVTDLLGSILEHAQAGQNLVVVDHGIAAGPSMPLAPSVRENKIFLQQPVLQLLERHRGGQLATRDLAPRLEMAGDELETLLDRADQVRRLNLGHLALRACDTGRKPDVLGLLKGFFGCSGISSPAELDVYVELAPNPGPTAIPQFQRQFPQTPLGGKAPDRWGIHVSGMMDFTVAFESAKALKDWVAAHLPAGGRYASGKLPAHGVNLSKGRKIFAFSGEPEYAASLRSG